MIKPITKKSVSISMDDELHALICEKFKNKSEYIEWVIYQDLLKKNTNGIEKIII